MTHDPDSYTVNTGANDPLEMRTLEQERLDVLEKQTTALLEIAKLQHAQISATTDTLIAVLNAMKDNIGDAYKLESRVWELESLIESLGEIK